MTQSVDEASPAPIAQVANEQLSTPMPQCADGNESPLLTAELFDSPAAKLSRNEKETSATPAYIGMLPIPLKARIDFAVVAGNSTKTNEHPSNAHDT